MNLRTFEQRDDLESALAESLVRIIETQLTSAIGLGELARPSRLAAFLMSDPYRSRWSERIVHWVSFGGADQWFSPMEAVRIDAGRPMETQFRKLGLGRLDAFVGSLDLGVPGDLHPLVLDAHWKLMVSDDAGEGSALQRALAGEPVFGSQPLPNDERSWVFAVSSRLPQREAATS